LSRQLSTCNCGLDIDLATHVQQLLFPKRLPVCRWCRIGTKNRMAKGLGGDYFEFITTGDKDQVVMIGDVTGHGLQASVVMSLIYGFIHHCTLRVADPLEILTQVNDFLWTFAARSVEYDHYFSTTLFCSVIDPDSLLMRYVNAGHVRPMVRRDDRIHFLDSTAQPLGFFENLEIGISSFQLKSGDRLFLYTDGITEAFNPQGQVFGRRRLEQLFLSHQEDQMDFLNTVFKALESFGAPDPPDDDCTAIILDINHS